MDGKQESPQGPGQGFSSEKLKQAVVPSESPPETPGLKREPRPSPKLLQRGLNMLTRLVSRKVDVTGMQHLDTLKPDDNVIFAVLHKHDSAITIASNVLAREFPLAISHQSTHNELNVMLRKLDPTGMLVKMLGKSNFVDVTYVFDQKRNEVVPKFNVEDYKNMKKVVEDGKALVIAAHNPSRTGDVSGPAGLSVAAAVSQIENAKIVPVYVDYDDPDQTLGLASNIVNTMKKRAVSRVVIGEPFQLEPVELGSIEQAAEKRALGKKITPQLIKSLNLDQDEQSLLSQELIKKTIPSIEDRLAVKVAHQKLKDHAQRIVQSIVSLRPPQKAA